MTSAIGLRDTAWSLYKAHSSEQSENDWAALWGRLPHTVELCASAPSADIGTWSTGEHRAVSATAADALVRFSEYMGVAFGTTLELIERAYILQRISSLEADVALCRRASSRLFEIESAFASRPRVPSGLIEGIQEQVASWVTSSFVGIKAETSAWVEDPVISGEPELILEIQLGLENRLEFMRIRRELLERIGEVLPRTVLSGAVIHVRRAPELPS